MVKEDKTPFMECLFWIGLFFFEHQVMALDIQWLGASCLTIKDEKTRLIFDPFVTRPPWWKVLTNSTLKSNKHLVKKYFAPSSKETAIIISHTHYDHVLDLPEVARLNKKASIYGPQETAKILEHQNIRKNRLNSLKEKKEFRVGQFKLTTFEVKHSPLPLGIEFSRGPMNLKGKKKIGAFDFKSLTSFSFLIEHPQGKILLHPTAEVRHYQDLPSIDLLIVGLTSWNTTLLKSNLINKIKAKKVMAIHHDNFFKKLNEPMEKMPFSPVLNEFPRGYFPLTFTINNKKKDKDNI